jgi:hypothetical protein
MGHPAAVKTICAVHGEIFWEVKTGAASHIVPTLRKVREEWGTRFLSFVSARLNGWAIAPRTPWCKCKEQDVTHHE